MLLDCSKVRSRSPVKSEPQRDAVGCLTTYYALRPTKVVYESSCVYKECLIWYDGMHDTRHQTQSGDNVPTSVVFMYRTVRSLHRAFLKVRYVMFSVLSTGVCDEDKTTNCSSLI